MNKVNFAVVCASQILKQGMNDKEIQEDSEDCALARIVPVGRLDRASDDMACRYLIKKDPTRIRP